MTSSATSRLVVALLVIAGGSSTAAVAMGAGGSATTPAAAAVDAPPGDDAQRVEFAPGTDNATVEGTVDAGTTNRYVLRAAGGQEMTVAVDSAELSAVITIYGTDGTVLHSGHVTAWVMLPADGDYVVEISSTGGTTSYAMTVQIHDSTPPPPGADTIQRIEFAPGTDNGTVEGVVGDGVVHRYVLWAAAGQTMQIGIDSVEENADLAVFDPTGREIVETADGFALPLNGDYVVEVWSEGGTSTYTMLVQIPGGETSPAPAERIRFAPGTNNASVNGDVAPATTNRYVLWAAEGQTMVVHIDSITDNVYFSIYAPDGTPLAEAQVQSTVVLPADGDYLVEVETTSSGGPYQASFWIE